MSINLISGCMFSGKTSALINIAKINKMICKKVMIINYIGDSRYSESTYITTHDKISLDCEQSETDIMTMATMETFLDSEVICINEGQFFKNLVEFCKIAASLNKHVHVCGLDGDYLKRPFGEILNLIPHCETVQKLNAICMSCKDGTPACFTKKILITSSDNLIQIGSTDIYLPVCRKCYDN